ncbi:hypothetical protein HORIV_09400 [Vreelandella olivaria]|uniref:IspG TIM-barrel domain-containing protein n=1 Tax=Vreelandella olivaria TaxID=390919 RepID=A0ABM7GDP8_9GAMM|nr:hypothetical protein HORIV_09400 [Halomonas olivaria]
MTNTNTLDVAATVAQIQQLKKAGADIVRVSVPDMDAAETFGQIKSWSMYRSLPISILTTKLPYGSPS